MGRHNPFEQAVALENDAADNYDDVRAELEDAYAMIDDEYRSLTPDEVAAAQIKILETEYEADTLMRDTERTMVIAEELRRVADAADQIVEPSMRDRQMILGVLNMASVGTGVDGAALAPGLESYGSDNRVAMESLRDNARKLWEQIKAAILKLARMIREQIQMLSVGFRSAGTKLQLVMSTVRKLRNDSNREIPREIQITAPGLVPADIRVANLSGVLQALQRNDELLTAVYRYGLGFQYAVEALPAVLDGKSAPTEVAEKIHATLDKLTVAPLATLAKNQRVFPGPVAVKEDQLVLVGRDRTALITQTYHLVRQGDTTPTFTLVNVSEADIDRIVGRLVDTYNGAVKFSKVLEHITDGNDVVMKKTDAYTKSRAVEEDDTGINEIFRMNMALNRWQYDLFVASTRNTMAMISRACDVLMTCMSAAVKTA